MNIVEAIRFYEEKFLSSSPHKYVLWVDIMSETMLKFKILLDNNKTLSLGYVDSPDMNETFEEYIQLEYIFMKLREFVYGVEE